MVAPVALPVDPLLIAEQRFAAVRVNFDRVKQRLPVWSGLLGFFQSRRRLSNEAEEEITRALEALDQLEEERPVIQEFMSRVDSGHCLLNRMGQLRKDINEYKHKFRPSKP